VIRIATKRDLSGNQIRDLLRHGLGSRVALEGYREITDGSFAAVYALVLADGREMVLKVGPPPGLRLLRYEVDLAHIEIEFYRRGGAAGVPVPALHAADPDLGYLLVDRLRGESLQTARSTMAPGELARVRHELGAICGRLRGVSDPLFGYPRRDGHTRSPSWRTSFLAFIEDVLADAVEYGRELPVPADEIGRLIERHAALLDDVTTPSLVHFDVWDGNVFVVPSPGGGYAVEGLIDGERSFYGDPVAELVSLALFADPAAVAGLLDGFLGRPLTDRERTRLRLYTVYLYLIIVTENATRGFDPHWHEPVRLATLDRLAAELAELRGPRLS
jgi:aminoglycoside phosphotransferase (APT) family kinase protein